MKISIIIPTHNRKDKLEQLLKSISYSFEKLKNHELIISIIVVNDGSTDGTSDFLSNSYPYIKVLNGDGNFWYTKSINVGFIYAIKNDHPDYLLTLNDDVILDEKYFYYLNLLLFNEDSGSIIGSIGITNEIIPRIVSSGNKWKNRRFGLYQYHLPFLSVVESIDNITGLYDSLTLPGRGMLIPIKVLKKLDLFDSSFIQYHSDSDFCLRAIKEGIRVKISWDLKIFVDLHSTSKSSSFKSENLKEVFHSFWNPYSRNYLPSKSRFIWRHNPKLYYPLIMGIFMLSVFKHKLFNK